LGSAEAELSKGQGWAYGDSLQLAFTLPDTSLPLQLRLAVSVDEDYAFRNLWLKFRLVQPNGKSQPPTQTELVLANELGEWYAEPEWGVYSFQSVLGRNIQLPDTGAYTLHLKHFMRPDTLAGVRAIQVWVQPWDSTQFPAPTAPEDSDTVNTQRPKWLKEEFLK